MPWDWLPQTHDLLVTALRSKVVRCDASQHNSAPITKHPQHPKQKKPTDPTGKFMNVHDFMLLAFAGQNMSTILSNISENHLGFLSFQKNVGLQRNQHLPLGTHFLGDLLTLTTAPGKCVLNQNTTGISTACIRSSQRSRTVTHQLFGVLAHGKQT